MFSNITKKNSLAYLEERKQPERLTSGVSVGVMQGESLNNQTLSKHYSSNKTHQKSENNENEHLKKSESEEINKMIERTRMQEIEIPDSLPHEKQIPLVSPK